MEKAAYVELTVLVLSFRKEEGKHFRDPNVGLEGQVNIMDFKGKEVWAGSGVCVKTRDNQKGTMCACKVASVMSNSLQPNGL